MSTESKRQYPRRVNLEGLEVEVRLMGASDRDAVLAFAQSLERHDLLFLRRDITRPEIVDTWLGEIEQGRVTTLLAWSENSVVGYGTLHRSELEWSRHVAEIRMLVAESGRGKGLGRFLTQEIFALAIESGIEKLVARMTTDQKGAIATFEGLGFRPEALMRDHVKDIDGNTHDLVVMSHSVEEFERTLVAYGVVENVS